MAVTHEPDNLECAGVLCPTGAVVPDAWTTWFIGYLPQAIVGMLVTPILLFKLFPPEVSNDAAPTTAAVTSSSGIHCTGHAQQQRQQQAVSRQLQLLGLGAEHVLQGFERPLRHRCLARTCKTCPAPTPSSCRRHTQRCCCLTKAAAIDHSPCNHPPHVFGFFAWPDCAAVCCPACLVNPALLSSPCCCHA